MPTIHPTATIDGDCDLAEDVTIGPNCVLIGPVTIGPGTRLLGNAYLNGPITLGADNSVYPYACLGFAPQHAKFDPDKPGLGLAIGNSNVFREHVTIHRAFLEDGPTRIGSHNYFMVNSHAGHDCIIGDHTTLVNNCCLGGHCVVEDHVIIGGATMVHQFCRLGRGAMLGGAMGTGLDILPWFMLTGNNVCGSVNLIGMRRSGFTREQIEDVRWIYRIVCREDHSMTRVLELLKERGDSELIKQYVEFIEASDRGICRARPKAARGMA